jgi:hypothetical protein
MNGSAISIETRLARPEVAQARYAYDQGAYWIVERHRNGSLHRRQLPEPPVGALCYRSDDDFLTWETFIVPGAAVTPALMLYLLVAIAAIPLAIVLTPGSVPLVSLLIGAGVAALAAFGARLEHLRRRDPATVNRIAVASALYLAAHHRHTHRR